MEGGGKLKMDTRIQHQIEYALQRSSFYRRKFGGLSAQAISRDFTSVPFTTKREILDDQEAHPPYGSNLCVDPRRVRRVHRTSGTTHNPVIIALTERDIAHVIDVGKKCFEACGLGPSHTVMHCLNFNMWAGGLTDGLSLEATGAAVVPFGVGNTRGLIEMVRFLKADTIHCTPSYLSKIKQVSADEFGMPPRELDLRLGLFGGEPGLRYPGFRQKIEDTWGIEAYDANYGLSEVLSIIASECSEKRGLHYRAAEKVYVELIDPETEECIPAEEGARGEMVFTNLCKEAQPLIRYRSGDIIEIKDSHCSCGSDGFVYEVVGRRDDMLVIRGINVFASAIEKVVCRWFGQVNDTYEILVSKSEPIETIIVRAEKNRSSNISDGELISRMRTDLKNVLGVGIEVDLVPDGTMERVEGKTKRLRRVL